MTKDDKEYLDLYKVKIDLEQQIKEKNNELYKLRREIDEHSNDKTKAWTASSMLYMCFVVAGFFIGSWMGGCMNGCAGEENHYFNSPKYVLDYGVDYIKYMQVKNITEHTTGNSKIDGKYSEYDLGDHIILIDTVGKYKIGDVVCTGKTIFNDK